MCQDCIQGLEKRVKSRFSQRSVTTRLCWTLEEFNTMIEMLLCIDQRSLDREDISSKAIELWNDWIRVQAVDDRRPFMLT